MLIGATVKTWQQNCLYLVTKSTPMITTYLALKVGAVLITALLPLGRPGKKVSKGYIALSDWAVNAKGELENISENEPNSHPIKTRY